MVAIAICLAGFSISNVLAQTTTTTNPGVVIDGVNWATHNVASKGTFVVNHGSYFSWFSYNDAQNACPNGWRLPTQVEFNSLSRVLKTWTNREGVAGYEFGSGSNTVFFPAIGYVHYQGEPIRDVGKSGNYWSSTLSSGSDHYKFYFDQSSTKFLGGSDWIDNQSVRCVCVDGTVKLDDVLLDNPGVVINGIKWATRNLSVGRAFAANYGSRSAWFVGNINIPPVSVCPDGWRLPTKSEFESLLKSPRSWTQREGLPGVEFGSGSNIVFFPALGHVNEYGWDFNLGTRGNYWSSTLTDDNSEYYTLYFDESEAKINTNKHLNADFYKYFHGAYVRCVCANNTGIDEVTVDTENLTITGYFDILGRRLQEEPTTGIYIIQYDNGKTKKMLK